MGTITFVAVKIAFAVHSNQRGASIASAVKFSELAMVYPLVAIPRWVASRYFYDFLGKALAYLLLPLLGINAVFRMISYLLVRAAAESHRG